MKPQQTSSLPALRWIATACRWLIVAALAAQLVFAHGCHGDADHELFGAIQRLVD